MIQYVAGNGLVITYGYRAPAPEKCGVVKPSDRRKGGHEFIWMHPDPEDRMLDRCYYCNVKRSDWIAIRHQQRRAARKTRRDSMIQEAKHS